MSYLKRIFRKQGEITLIHVYRPMGGAVECRVISGPMAGGATKALLVVSTELMVCSSVDLPPGAPLKNAWMAIEEKLPTKSASYAFECFSVFNHVLVTSTPWTTLKEIKTAVESLMGPALNILGCLSEGVLATALCFEENKKKQAQSDLFDLTTSDGHSWIVSLSGGATRKEALPCFQSEAVQIRLQEKLDELIIRKLPDLKVIYKAYFNGNKKETWQSVGVPWILSAAILSSYPMISQTLVSNAIQERYADINMSDLGRITMTAADTMNSINASVMARENMEGSLLIIRELTQQTGGILTDIQINHTETVATIAPVNAENYEAIVSRFGEHATAAKEGDSLILTITRPNR